MSDLPLAPRSTRETVETLLSAWQVFDIDGLIATLAPDCVYAVHVDEGVFPLAGEIHGPAAIRETLLGFRRVLEYRLWRPFPLVVEGEAARNQLEFLYRDWITGEEIAGRCRFVWHVVDGLIVRCDEYHDARRLETFFRLMAEGKARMEAEARRKGEPGDPQ